MQSAAAPFTASPISKRPSQITWRIIMPLHPPSSGPPSRRYPQKSRQGATSVRVSTLGAERTGEPIIERATIRPFILISALLVFAYPAVAQNWQEYSYPDYSFRATFPAHPHIEPPTDSVTA